MSRRLAALLAVLAFSGCGLVQSDAYKVYLAFEHEIHMGNCPKLKALAVGGGGADGWIDNYCGYKGGPSAAAAVAQMGGSPSGLNSETKLESEDEDAKGVVTLVARVHRWERSSETHDAVPIPDHRHTLRLLKEGGALKVLDYTDTEIKD